MADMIYNYINRYNYTDIITKIKINNKNGYLYSIFIAYLYNNQYNSSIF